MRKLCQTPNHALTQLHRNAAPLGLDFCVGYVSTQMSPLRGSIYSGVIGVSYDEKYVFDPGADFDSATQMPPLRGSIYSGVIGVSTEMSPLRGSIYSGVIGVSYDEKYVFDPGADDTTL